MDYFNENFETSKWNQNALIAQQYYEQNGDLLVPCTYVTNDGFPLGAWIQKQRSRYRYKNENTLNDDQIKTLESIGMVWDIREYNWQNNFAIAKEFFIRNGHLKIPYEYIIDDISIGKWIHTQRKAYNHQGNCKITDEHIKQLENIGMIWDLAELRWEENYAFLQEYYKNNGNINISSSYKSPNGDEIGYWLWSLKKDYQNDKLPKQKIIALEKLGICWHNPNNNAKIISWIIDQEKLRKENPISITAKQLNIINGKNQAIELSIDKWDSYYKFAKDFLDTHKINTIPQNLVVDDKYNVGKWFQIQRNLYKTNQLSTDQTLKFKKLLRRRNNVAVRK